MSCDRRFRQVGVEAQQLAQRRRAFSVAAVHQAEVVHLQMADQPPRGKSLGQRRTRRRRPFSGDQGDYGAYFSLRREQRTLSEQAQRYGTRTGYIGSEVFLSLVDEHHAPWHDEVRYLSADVMCTSRDLPLMLQQDPVRCRTATGWLPKMPAHPLPA